MGAGMKFYVVESPQGETIACFTSKTAALSEVASNGTVQMVDAPVTADTIRRLLGQMGGFAKDARQIWPTF